MDYESIKGLAKSRGCRVSDLIALAPQNDPFYTGTPTDRRDAVWFAQLWHDCGFVNGVHLRRVHYAATAGRLDANGKPYENTEAAWVRLSTASKAARYIGLVAADAFIDQRNPEPVLHPYEPPAPDLYVTGEDFFAAPPLPPWPDVEMDGFRAVRPVHVEVWCEKSTMNDVLGPLCEARQINLQIGTGEFSVTLVNDLVRRLDGRPCRILYISDFDPAGRSMPVAVSRKIEFFLQSRPGADVRLYPIVLTADQVQEYRLPRTPIKETERRSGAFEERFGEGAVELDALEALHPGALRRIVEEAVDHYCDPDADEATNEASEVLAAHCAEVREQVLGAHQAEIADLEQAWRETTRDLAERAKALRRVIRHELAEALPGDVAAWLPDPADREELPDPLFDSTRNYLDQLAAYKAFQGKGDAVAV